MSSDDAQAPAHETSVQTNEQKPKMSLVRITSIGGAVMGTIVGSGFASGQEVLQFFTSYGVPGIWGAIITTALFAFMCAGVTYYGYKFAGSKHFSAYRHYCGKYFGMFLDIFTVLFCFAVAIVMTSGSGAMLQQQFGLPTYVGSIGMAILALLSAMLDMDRLTRLLGSLAPVCILYIIVVSLITAAANWGNLANADAMVAAADANGEVLRAVGSAGIGFAMLSALNYVAHNIIAATPFVSEVGTTAKSQKEAIWGGVIGGIMLGLCGLALNIAMLTTYDTVHTAELPGLAFAQALSPVAGGIFVIVLVIMIYNSIVPMMLNVTNLFVDRKTDPVKFRIFMITLAIAVLLGGQFPFSQMINIIYPFVGYVGIIFLVAMVVQLIRWKIAGKPEPQE